MEQDFDDLIDWQDELIGFLRMYMAVSLSIFHFRFSFTPFLGSSPD